MAIYRGFPLQRLPPQRSPRCLWQPESAITPTVCEKRDQFTDIRHWEVTTCLRFSKVRLLRRIRGKGDRRFTPTNVMPHQVSFNVSSEYQSCHPDDLSIYVMLPYCPCVHMEDCHLGYLHNLQVPYNEWWATFIQKITIYATCDRTLILCAAWLKTTTTTTTKQNKETCSILKSVSCLIVNDKYYSVS